MCSKLFEQNPGQRQAQPAAIVRANLEILGDLALRNGYEHGTRRDAMTAIETQANRQADEILSANAEIERLKGQLAKQTDRANRLSGQLSEQEAATWTAQNVAQGNRTMAVVIRDLTKLFPDAELAFEQTDAQGYEYRVTGYEELDMTVDVYNYHVKVRNTTRRRRARTYSLDSYGGLSDQVLEGLESLFPQLELTKSNTPSSVHDELFEPEPSSEPFGPDCGNPYCMVHGKGGIADILGDLVGNGVQVIDLSVRRGNPFV